MISEARTNGHTYAGSLGAMGATTGALGTNHIWVLGDDGLQGWVNNGQFTPVEPTTMRRAIPLTVRSMDNSALNISDMTHPGMEISLRTPPEIGRAHV